MSNEKMVTIYVESTPHDWPKNGDISYDQVVKLEEPNYSPASGISYSVKFTKGNGNKPEGTLSPGATMKVKDGISFTVSETGQS